MFFLGWYLDPEKKFPDPILLPGMIQMDKSLPFCSLDRISKSYITVLRNLVRMVVTDTNTLMNQVGYSFAQNETVILIPGSR